MPDAPSRAEHYRDLAEECRRLAAIGSSTDKRERYLRMVKYYSAMAAVEQLRMQMRLSGD